MRSPLSRVRSSLRSQLILMGAGSVVLTAVVLAAIGGAQTSSLADEVAADVNALSDASVTAAATQAQTLVATQVATVTDRMAGELTVAQSVMDSTGDVSFGEPVAWNAVNQVTKESSPVSLPAMTVGGQWLGQNTDAATATPVVDEIAELLGSSATVFQRMNDAGDMLRVATTVANTDGSRAIGTYIPAVAADGSANPVVAALLSGQPFHGTAVVVGQVFVAAYAPILDSAGEVVGAVFVGTPQSTVDEPLVAALTAAKVGVSGYITVQNADGSWVVPPPGVDAADTSMVDTAGTAVTTTLTTAAAELTDGTAKVHLDLADGGATVEAARYAPWGWTISAWAQDAELEAVANRMHDGSNSLVVVLMVVGLLVALVALGLIVTISSRIVRRVQRLTAALGRVAERDLSVEVTPEGADEIGRMGSALQEAVGEMRLALERMLSGAEAVRSTADQLEGSSGTLSSNAGQTSTRADSAAQSASVVSNEVQTVTAAMTEMRSSIESVSHDVHAASAQTTAAVDVTAEAAAAAQRLGESSSQIAAVLSAVNAIAGQTHLLALNATIEAARAGEAGKGFAVVASEVKELAQQTSQAIETIAPVLAAVTRDAGDVLGAVERIGQSIAMVDEHQSSMAAVVEQQTATTGDIERNLMTAADSTTDIAGTMAAVADAAAQALEGAHDMRSAVEALGAVATELTLGVEQFTLVSR